ncbi:hypothetical protein C8Q78DRAFT_280146 [Trametes maxima]|nr:hypothetical protein C8Q78DRAFT_280146 [Trametes maxima]
MAFIHELPDEVLVDILLEALRVSKPDRSPERFPGTLIDYPEDIGSYAWVPYTHVCRRWRDVVLSNSLLWRAFDIRNDVDAQRLLHMLDHSGDTTLEVCFPYNLGSDLAVRHLPALYPYSARFRAVHIHYIAQDSGKVVLPHFFERPFPALEDLTLVSWHPVEEDDASNYPSFDISPERFPSLHTALLCRFSVSWETHALSRMRRLALDECSYAGPPLTLASFLDVLESLQSLEDLRLFPNFLSSACGEAPLVPTPRRRLIVLPRLRHIGVGDIPSLALGLLLSVQLPRDVQIGGYFESLNIDTAKNITFTPLIPSDRTLLPVMRTADYARVRASLDTMQIHGRNSADGSSLTMSIIAVYVEWWSCLPQALNGLIEVFGDSPLRELELHGCPDRVSMKEYVTLFEQFPTLEVLHIDSHYSSSLEEIFNALAEPVKDEAAPSLPDGPTGTTGRAICPHLKRVKLVDLEWDENDSLFAVESCLRARAARGAYLEELYLDLDYRGILRQDIETYTAPFRAVLRELVMGGNVKMC